MISVLKVRISTLIISVISGAIVKISVPITKKKEILMIPKHPQLAKFAQNLADITAKNKVADTLLFKIKYQTNFGKL